MAFPYVTTVLDNFNRADENPISTPWAASPISPGAGRLKVASNVLTPALSSGGNGYLSGTYGPDMSVQLTIVTPPTAGHYAAIFLRGSNFGTSNWQAYYLVWIAGSPNDQWDLRKRVNGTVTTGLGGTTFLEPTASAGDKLGVAVVGSTFQIQHYTAGAWSLVASVTDTDLATGGSIGVEADGVATYDDLSGGTVTSNSRDIVDTGGDISKSGGDITDGGGDITDGGGDIVP